MVGHLHDTQETEVRFFYRRLYGGRSVAVSARLTVNQEVGVRLPSTTLVR